MSTITKTALTVYKSVSFSPIEMFNNILILNNCSEEHFLSPRSLSIVKDKILTSFPLGMEVTSVQNPTKFIVDLLKGLIELEDLGMTHGDIKLENIVLHNENYKFIDFGIIQNLTDDSIISQTHNDYKGYALKNGVCGSGYTSHRQAMYALGITITSILSSNNNWMNRELRGCLAQISIGDLDMNYYMSECAYEIYKDPDHWILCNVEITHSFFSQLIKGLVVGAYPSFRAAYSDFCLHALPRKVFVRNLLTLPTNNYSFVVYDECAKRRFSPISSAIVMTLYYSFWNRIKNHSDLITCILSYFEECECTKDHHTMFTAATGLEVTYPIPDMVVERLLCEYLHPGSWICQDYEVPPMGTLLLESNLPNIIIKRI